MSLSNHYRHVKPHKYETTDKDMLQASIDAVSYTHLTLPTTLSV